MYSVDRKSDTERCQCHDSSQKSRIDPNGTCIVTYPSGSIKSHFAEIVYFYTPSINDGSE